MTIINNNNNNNNINTWDKKNKTKTNIITFKL